VYFDDLAVVHDEGFGDLARRAAPEMARLLRARGIRGGLVVDVGCGSGIAAQHFVARGCSAVTAIGEVVTYLRGLPALARFFRRVGRAAPRRVLAFDFVESAAKRTGPTKSFAGEGWTLASQARLDASGRVPHAPDGDRAHRREPRPGRA